MLISILIMVGSAALLAMLYILVLRAAHWLSHQAEKLLGLAAYRRRAHGPAAERVLAFLGFELYSRREYGLGAVTEFHPLAGATVDPGGGVGPARLGMSPAEVVAALGRSLGYDAWDDGNLNDSLIYDGVRLSFDRCDHRGPLPRSRLWVAEVRRPDAMLLGRPLCDWQEEELIATLSDRGLQTKIVEPGYAEFVGPYLRTWFESGRLTGVEVAE